MHTIFFALSLIVSQSLFALPTQFPDWLTDDKAKVWTVNQTIELMKDREFYKIKNFEVKREFSVENNCDYLKAILTFDDPKCANREVALSTFAPLCNDRGCRLTVTLSGCRPGSNAESTTQILMSR